jgi:signal transduction histidine kinase
VTTDVPDPPGRLERRLPPLTATVAVLGAAFGTVVLHRSPAALGGGLLAQLAATWILVRLRTRPYAGMAAVAVVASVLAVLPSPWQELLAAQAVPWVPLALAWATVRAIENSRTPAQLRLSGLIALAYVVGAGAHGPAAAMGAAAPILGGLCASLAKRLNLARHDRVAALGRERAAVARAARADERRRVAAEMHGTLGHLLTLLVLRANVLMVRTSDPAASEAAEQMSRLGNEGLAELRSLLDLLGGPRDDREPSPSLEALVSEARDAGQAVDLVQEGDQSTVPPAVARAVHGTVREGLTNARRHAPGAEVTVTVTVAEDAVEVVVRNGPAREPGSGPGTGRGLDGVRTRVALLGGSGEHAPTADGGYAVRATLPLRVRTSGTRRGPT